MEFNIPRIFFTINQTLENGFKILNSGLESWIPQTIRYQKVRKHRILKKRISENKFVCILYMMLGKTTIMVYYLILKQRGPKLHARKTFQLFQNNRASPIIIHPIPNKMWVPALFALLSSASMCSSTLKLPGKTHTTN